MYNNDFDQTRRPVNERPIQYPPYMVHQQRPVLIKRSGVKREGQGTAIVLISMLSFFAGFFLLGEGYETLGPFLSFVSFVFGIFGIGLFFMGRFS